MISTATVTLPACERACAARGLLLPTRIIARLPDDRELGQTLGDATRVKALERLGGEIQARAYTELSRSR